MLEEKEGKERKERRGFETGSLIEMVNGFLGPEGNRSEPGQLAQSPFLRMSPCRSQEPHNAGTVRHVPHEQGHLSVGLEDQAGLEGEGTPGRAVWPRQGENEAAWGDGSHAESQETRWKGKLGPSWGQLSKQPLGCGHQLMDQEF